MITLPPGVRLVLASASPRRSELLRSIGLDFEVRPADLDESIRPGERPQDYVLRLSVEKAAAVASSDVIVVGADTTVEVDGQVLGKPLDDDDARRMLALLSGRVHQVHTGVTVIAADGLPRPAVGPAVSRTMSPSVGPAVSPAASRTVSPSVGPAIGRTVSRAVGPAVSNTISPAVGTAVSRMVSTAVEFTALDAAAIDDYVATGEPMDKAGAYAIQGAGGALVLRVDGSVSNVIGLPLAETLGLLRSAVARPT